jgi:hypothetical protein
METTERQTTKPIGLARFLVSHGDCGEGFETLRDRRVITVFCRGCEASFSYLTDSARDSSKGVETALGELAEPSGPDGNDDNGLAPAQPPPLFPAQTPPLERLPTRRGGVRYVPPPGPLSPELRITPTGRQRIDTALHQGVRHALALLQRHRRPIALAVLALAGAFVLIALTDGGESNSSQETQPESVQVLVAGGPEALDLGDGEGQFDVDLPPTWLSATGTDGRVLLGPVAGGAEIQVLAQPSGDPGTTVDLSADAAALLAQGLPRGARVQSLSAQPVGSLIAVARAKTGSGVRTAYVAPGETAAYLVIEHVRDDAAATVKLQAQGVISSFDPTA